MPCPAHHSTVPPTDAHAAGLAVTVDLDRGADGFRFDVAHGPAKPPGLPDRVERVDSAPPAHPVADPRLDHDDVHELHRGLRRTLDGYPGAMPVDEVWIDDDDRVACYTRPDERHLGFNFRLTTAPWEPAALLLLGLPGVAHLYNGGELGLPDVALPDAALPDPVWERSGTRRRRVPMPWSGTAAPYGFGSAAATWLPMPADWAELTVEAELADPTSMRWLYRRALDIRRQHRAIVNEVGGPTSGRTCSPSSTTPGCAACSTSVRPDQPSRPGPSCWPAPRCSTPGSRRTPRSGWAEPSYRSPHVRSVRRS